MIPQEFSNEFDILYNVIMSNQAPGLDEYEKSVFLTIAQESVVLDLYNGNSLGEAFEDTEMSRRFLNELIETSSINPVIDESLNIKRLEENSQLFKLPSNILVITYEEARFDANKIPVIPVTQDEYHKIKNNPFRGATTNRVLRLDFDSKINDKKVTENYVELISLKPIETYFVKYLSKPTPIVLCKLTDLDPKLSINGVTEQTNCMLNDSLHRIILDRAVKLARTSVLNGVQI